MKKNELSLTHVWSPICESDIPVSYFVIDGRCASQDIYTNRVKVRPEPQLNEDMLSKQLRWCIHGDHFQFSYF